MSDAPLCSTHGPASLVDGRVVYPHRPDLAHLAFWICDTCGAYCGCHPGTTRPLGVPAQASTRRARKLAHDAFDQIWVEGEMSRRAAYAWLSHAMGLDPIHIGALDEEQCRRVVHLCDERRRRP